jgi:putative transcriptional regulator
VSAFGDDAFREFYDPEFRHAYADRFLQIRIASQLKALREQRDWTQKELAEKAGMKQSRISAMENVNFDSWNIRTLRRLARAFDVTLNVEFKEFGKRLVQDMETLGRENLEAVPFDEDPIFRRSAEVAELRVEPQGEPEHSDSQLAALLDSNVILEMASAGARTPSVGQKVVYFSGYQQKQRERTQYPEDALMTAGAR